MNFWKQLVDFATVLDVSAAELAKVDDDNKTVQWLAQADVAAEANGRAFREYRDILIYGVRNSPLPPPPPTDLPVAPADLGVAIIDRLVRLVDTIEDADGFNAEIASALGIVPPTAERPPESDWKPLLKVKDGNLYKLIVEFTKGDADGLTLDKQIGDANEWSNAGTFFKSPVEITITPTTPNAPVSVRLRACFVKGNQPVGEMSETYNAVARP